VPVASVEDNFFAIAISDKIRAASLDDFVRLARAQPGRFNWAATPGLPVFIFEALQKKTDIRLTQVSYRDFGPALGDLDEGRIDVVVTSLNFLLPQARAGKARLLMVTNGERARIASDVPTAGELGFPDLTFDGVVGLYGWRDMPIDLREKIAADVRAVGADRAISERIESMGSVVRVGTPAEFASAIEAQRAKIAEVARGMKPTQ
jgi:tripartite-type tricarboxylate transporter receptor subunit TctC